MRHALVGAAIVLVALMAVPVGTTLPGAAPSHALPSAEVRATPAAVTPSARSLFGSFLERNATVPASSTVTSGYQDTAPPPVPRTSPTVVSVVANGRGCCYYVNQTPAGGPWDSVVLNYTGSGENGVYDSSFRASVDGVQVLFGTTPEYGTWTVLDNITEYESLLEPGANFTFILSAAVLSGGYFLTSVTLSFYPAPAGAPVPSEPTEVIPLWNQYIKPTLPTVTANASVPSDAVAATLELWTYGYGSDGGDEFWWADAGPQRAVDIALDGAPFAAVYPFPYVNTGGIDLFLWRPIPAAFTLSDRPYEVNVSGALGAIEGVHSYNASIDGRNTSCDWYMAGALLVWTDPAVTGATLTSSSATFPVASGGSTDTSSTQFADNSTLHANGGPIRVSTTGGGAFDEQQASEVSSNKLSEWENITQSSTFDDQTVAAGPNGTTYANTTRDFAFGTDLGDAIAVSTASGTYPEYYNITASMLSFDQAWTEADSVANVTSLGRETTSYALDNEVLGANGVFDEEYEIPMMGSGASGVAYPLIESSTPTYTAEEWSASGGYAHVMAGSDYQPTNPDLAETLLQNRFDTTPLVLGAVAHATRDPVDAGGPTVLVAAAHGGEGVDTFAWSSLPPGCTSSDTPALTCQPSAPGTYAPVATVSDSAGDVATSDPVVLIVEPALTIVVRPSTPGADLGGSLAFSAVITGGAAPYNCSWTVAGVPTTGACDSVPAPTAGTGPVSASVSVTDATGAVANASSGAVMVNSALGAGVVALNASGTAGSAIEFTVRVTGGTGPFVIVWLKGSAPLLGDNGTTLTYVPSSAGTLSITAQVVDATGASTTSNTVSVAVTASSAPVGTAGGGSSNDLDTPLFWVAVALAAVAGIEAVFLISERMPPPRRP